MKADSSLRAFGVCYCPTAPDALISVQVRQQLSSQKQAKAVWKGLSALDIAFPVLLPSRRQGTTGNPRAFQMILAKPLPPSILQQGSECSEMTDFRARTAVVGCTPWVDLNVQIHSPLSSPLPNLTSKLNQPEDKRNALTFHPHAMTRSLIQTHLVYKMFSTSYTIKIFYSQRATGYLVLL